MSPTKKLMEICALCIERNKGRLKPTLEEGHCWKAPDVAKFCGGMQAEGACDCWKEFVSKMGKRKKQSAEFCKKCCNGHGLEVAPVYMWAEAGRGLVACPLELKLFRAVSDREKSCPMKLAKISMKGAQG